MKGPGSIFSISEERSIVNLTNMNISLLLCLTVPMTTGLLSSKHCRQPYFSDRCDSCKIGWWGNRCEFTCRGHCDISGCHQSNGSCLGCGAGYYTEGCTTPCPDNCYPTYEHNVYCHRVTGECLEGCRLGWWGSRCERRCSTGCEGVGCYQDDGKCTKACNPGWSGDRCNVSCHSHCASAKDGRRHCHWNTRKCRDGCTHGWWDSHCDKECSSNCVSNSCYHVDGYCTEGCRAGWTGDRCDVRCPSGCRDDTCAQDGRQECTNGCRPTFYGHHCNKTCNTHCVDRECFHDHHLKTTVCTKGCVEGRWSHNCRKKCLDNCDVCERRAGQCVPEDTLPSLSHASKLQVSLVTGGFGMHLVLTWWLDL